MSAFDIFLALSVWLGMISVVTWLAAQIWNAAEDDRRWRGDRQGRRAS